MGSLHKCSYYSILSLCAFVVYVCANVGVTFQKTQTISPLHTLNPWIIAYYLPLLKVLLQVKRTKTRTKKHHERDCKLCINAPNPISSNYTKSRFFAVLVSENTGKTLLTTYKKSHFGAFWYLWGQTKGAKGGEVERLPACLNAWTHRQPTTRTDKQEGNSHDKHPEGTTTNRRGQI